MYIFINAAIKLFESRVGMKAFAVLFCQKSLFPFYAKKILCYILFFFFQIRFGWRRRTPGQILIEEKQWIRQSSRPSSLQKSQNITSMNRKKKTKKAFKLYTQHLLSTSPFFSINAVQLQYLNHLSSITLTFAIKVSRW